MNTGRTMIPWLALTVLLMGCGEEGDGSGPDGDTPGTDSFADTATDSDTDTDVVCTGEACIAPADTDTVCTGEACIAPADSDTDTPMDTDSPGNPGEVLWYADPALALTDVFRRLDPDGNANPTGDQCVDDPDNPPVATVKTDPTFGAYWSIHKPPSRKRAEFARTSGFVPQEGGEYYIGWRWRLTSTPPLTAGIAVFQWKTDAGTEVNTQNYPFNMGYDGTELTINAYGPGDPDWTEGASINNRRTTLWRHAAAPGQWMTFVFRVKVSRDPAVGFIEFWYNGVQQTLMNANVVEYQAVLANGDTRAYHKTNDGKEVYMKWGAYNESACDFDITVDFHDMRVATTYALAAP